MTMDKKFSASSLKHRPSVIKWVGKSTTADTDCNESKMDETTPEVERLAQEYKRIIFSDECSLGDRQKAMNKESLLPKSKKAEGRFECSKCNKQFKWRSHWKSHERTHTGERPFKCELCGKAFTRSDGLQSHKKVHVKNAKAFSTATEPNYSLGKDVLEDVTVLKQEKFFICAYCGRTFVSFAGYCRHIDGHKVKEYLKCHFCNIVFSRPSAFKIHNRVHTGLQPYTCNICFKTFSIRGNLKRHLFIHTGDKPYNCTYCSRCFNNSSHLARHVRSKHEKQSVPTQLFRQQ